MCIGRRFIIFLWVGYAVLAVGSKSYLKATDDPAVEVFPFFTWSLFSKVQDPREEFAIEVEMLDGQQFAPPVDVLELAVPRGLFRETPIAVHKSIQALAQSNGDGRRLAFEGNYLGGHAISYRIVLYRFDPMDRWRTGNRGSPKILGHYQTKEQ